MSATSDKIAVTCPQCSQQLLVPSAALGKQGRCPSCKHVFPLDRSVEAQVVEPPPSPPQASIWDEMPPADYALAPLPQGPQPASTVPNPYAPSSGQTEKGKYNHGFGWEHRGWDAGIMGGLGMMVVGLLWFFVGLAFDHLFFYPVILFFIGLAGFFRGLFTGNVSGR